MKGVVCTEFVEDENSKRIIGGDNGEKTTYNVNHKTFMENGKDSGEVVINAYDWTDNDIDKKVNMDEKTKQELLGELRNNLGQRVTEHALDVKEKMLNEGNQQKNTDNDLKTTGENKNHQRDDEEIR